MYPAIRQPRISLDTRPRRGEYLIESLNLLERKRSIDADAFVNTSVE